MMAVPFALPEDEINNLITTVIFILSQTRLEPAEENHELQERMEELVRLLMEEFERRSRTSQYDNQLKRTLYLLQQSLSQFTQLSTPNSSEISERRSTTNQRSRRIRRSNSESSCCGCDDDKNAKLSFHDLDDVTEDCCQVGLVLRKIADYESNAIIKETTTIVREKEFVDGHHHNTHQHHNQQQDNLVDDSDDDDDDATLSHFVPEVRRIFWTAVPLICMVGWHLFQTNYCM